MNTSSNRRDTRPGNPYRVPDGYFAELRNTLRERAGSEGAGETTVPGRGLWQRIRGVAGLSAAFGCLILFAATGYYFTGYRAGQREQLASQEQTGEMLLGYHVYTEDIEKLDAYASDTGAADEDRAGFAEAVTEYLDTYGYGGTDLLAALTDTGNDW